MTSPNDASNEQGIVLNLLCTQQDDAWRLYAGSDWMPQHLQRCFDEHGEAYPVFLDFEDLERYMQKRGLAFEKRETRRGDIELKARDQAAVELAIWLSMALASGFRQSSGLEHARGKTPGAAG
jgi:hypothetical protein